MEKRKLTKEDIDKVRGIEGFPIGSDEDIIALSDAPYYTACPNPFIEEFIEENGHPYDESTDDYHCEPFASDVSEGKNDPIYMAHAYHTKVPYKAIMRYILHYTKPNDIVLDGFCGTGMTGVAALMCGNPSDDFRGSIGSSMPGVEWGRRNAIVNDLSPIATFISSVYNSELDVRDFEANFKKKIAQAQNDYQWMYQTNHPYSATSFIPDIKGVINYTVWSDVFICPHCGKEIVFWDAAVNDEITEIKDHFLCDNCGMSLTKRDCEKAKKQVWDTTLGTIIETNKQVPVLINYTYAGKRFEKKPDDDDLALIDKIDKLEIKDRYPVSELIDGDKMSDPRHAGIDYVFQFWTKRNLIILARLFALSSSNAERFVLTSIIQNSTRMYKFRTDRKGGIVTGTLFIPSLNQENNIFNLCLAKLSSIATALSPIKGRNVVTLGSATNLPVQDNCIDYIFTDPPFGYNINYSELSFLWESWLNILTNNTSEAIMSKYQKKGLLDYQDLMFNSFKEYYRVLKPNRWITIEFHNSQNSVWNAIQEAISKAGFIIADVRTIDKKQGSFNQVKGATQAIKQDLVISAYKPKDEFTKEFKLKAGTEKTAWSFVRQHLSNLPVTVKKGGRLEVLSERQAFLLWDRMVAYHIMHGIAVPMDAADFYQGLDEKYLKRDNMYFLPSQVNQYDKVRATCEVENIQFSLFVSDEKSAIGWLYQQLDKTGEGPQTYAELMPKFMQELKAVDKREKMPELMVILEENFLKDDKGRWYIPDYTKSGDIAKLREKNLLKEFAEYQQSKGKLKQFRSEAIRAGFSKLWKDKDYRAIVEMAERLPEETIQEDSNLLMYYDISLSRAEAEPSQLSLNIN